MNFIVHVTARFLAALLIFQAVASPITAAQLDSRRNRPSQVQDKRQTKSLKPTAADKAGPPVDFALSSSQPSALFVVGSTNLTTCDAAIKTRLEGLGYIVTTKSGSPRQLLMRTART